MVSAKLYRTRFEGRKVPLLPNSLGSPNHTGSTKKLILVLQKVLIFNDFFVLPLECREQFYRASLQDIIIISCFEFVGIP